MKKVDKKNIHFQIVITTVDSVNSRKLSNYSQVLLQDVEILSTNFYKKKTILITVMGGDSQM